MTASVRAVAAYLLSGLVFKRSILTGKVARNGARVSHEYGVDPLEAVRVADVMTAAPVTLARGDPVPHYADLLGPRTANHRQRVFPVTGNGGALPGVLTASDLDSEVGGPRRLAADLAHDPSVALPHETLRAVAERMV